MTQKQKLEMNSIKQQYEKNGLALKPIISFAEIQMFHIPNSTDWHVSTFELTEPFLSPSGDLVPSFV